MEEENQQSATQKDHSPSVSSRLLRGLARIILVLVTGLIIGTALYFGLMFLYKELVLNTRSANSQLELMVTQQAGNLKQQEDRLGQINQRVSSIESNQTTENEASSEMQSKLNDVQKTLNQQNTELIRLEDLQSTIATLEKELEQDRTDIKGLMESNTAPDSPLAKLRRETRVLKAMELLNRSRLNFIQNNYGLAGEDIKSVRQILLAIQTESTEAEKVNLQAWIGRLDMALQNLPVTPILAFEDLEITWGMMARGLEITATPEQFFTITSTHPATIEPSQSTSVTVTQTPTATLTLSLTPMVTATVTPSK